MTLLDDVTSCRTIGKLKQLVKEAKPELTLFWGRRLTVEGHGGSIRFNDILKKADLLFKNLETKETEEACQLLREILLREKITSTDPAQTTPKGNFFYKTVFNIVYSIKKFFGNWGRDTLISRLTKTVLDKNPKLLKELPFHFQLQYCKQHPEALKSAKHWVQKLFYLENDKNWNDVSPAIKMELAKHWSKKKFRLNFIFSGITAKDLELHNGDKKITIEDKTMTLNEIADHILNKIREIENEDGVCKGDLLLDVTQQVKEISYGMHSDRLHLVIQYSKDPVLNNAESKNSTDQTIIVGTSCLDEIIDALIDKKFMEPMSLSNVSPARIQSKIIRIPERNVKAERRN